MMNRFLDNLAFFIMILFVVGKFLIEQSPRFGLLIGAALLVIAGALNLVFESLQESFNEEKPKTA